MTDMVGKGGREECKRRARHIWVKVDTHGEEIDAVLGVGAIELLHCLCVCVTVWVCVPHFMQYCGFNCAILRFSHRNSVSGIIAHKHIPCHLRHKFVVVVAATAAASLILQFLKIHYCISASPLTLSIETRAEPGAIGI